MRVLVADSQDDIKSTMCEYIRGIGYEVIVAKHGHEVIELFESEKPQMIIIDLDLQGLDAKTTVRQLRASCHDISEWIPILFLAGTRDEQLINEAIESGGDDFILKPVSQRILEAKFTAIRRLISMRQNLIDFGQQLRQLNDRLLATSQIFNELSQVDPLTKIANRRAFDDDFDISVRSCIRNSEPLSVLLIDIDDFKIYNDQYGHQAGDQCLYQVAQKINSVLLRPNDFVARYGGEEFAVVLPGVDVHGASIVAERIRCAIVNEGLKHPTNPENLVTVSIGVASSHPSRNFCPDKLIQLSDLALYEAKNHGRNCVFFCEQATEMLDEDEKPTYKRLA